MDKLNILMKRVDSSAEIFKNCFYFLGKNKMREKMKKKPVRKDLLDDELNEEDSFEDLDFLDE